MFLAIFLFLGGMANYFSLWLESSGWEHHQMGWLEGIKYFAITTSPIFWGRFADRTGRPVLALSIVAWGSAVAFLPVALTTRFAIVFGAITMFNLFRVAVVPLTDVITIAEAERSGTDYGRIRIWGSWGFIAGGLLMAVAVKLMGRSVVPYVLACLLILTALLTSRLPEAPPRARSDQPTSLRDLLANPTLRAFLIISFLWRLAGQGLYMFLPLHLSDLGVTDSLVPVWWTVGVLSEIVLLRFAPEWFGHIRPGRVLLLCYSACVLQFGLTAAISSAYVLLPVMILHGFTFGLAYYTSVLWLSKNVPEESRATAQALFQSISFGVGGGISVIAAGYLFGLGRGPLMFGVAAIAALGAVGVAALLLRQRPASSSSV